jgi:selenocysteine lyase/cysteine desulfurase
LLTDSLTSLEGLSASYKGEALTKLTATKVLLWNSGTDNIEAREEELLDLAFKLMREVDDVTILADDGQKRIGAMSFYIEYIHFNLLVKLLNDHFGIQVRGGCACAGTYGHYMLDVTPEKSQSITCEISAGDLTHKPGWVRWSIHPTTTNKEIIYFAESIKKIVANFDEWKKDYEYSSKTNEFTYAGPNKVKKEVNIEKLFKL